MSSQGAALTTKYALSVSESGSPDQLLKRGFDSVRTLDSRFTHVLPLHIITTSLFYLVILRYH